MTTPSASMTTRHRLTFRKDTDMNHIELRLATIQERQSLLRSHREADRAANASTRSIRHRLGGSLIRLGQRVAGEHLGSPALTG